MPAVGTKLQTVALLASGLVSSCTFFPEQLLVPGETMTDQSTLHRRGTMASAVSSAVSEAGAAAPRTTSGISMVAASQTTAAGSGGAMSSAPSGSMDAGTMSRDASAPVMNTPMASAGSSAMPAAGSGAAGMGGGEAPKQATDPSCDLSGVWMTHQLSASKALEEVGFSNSYAYYEIEQSATDFVVKKHIDCGGIALGGGTASLSRAGLQALTEHNSQSGRKGRFALVDGKCALEVDHFWSVRGADEPRYLPTPTRDSTMSLAEMQQMKPLPTRSMPDGAEDWDNDGELGIASQLSGLISGARNGCQRDWDHWFTAPGYEITPSTEFTSYFTTRFEFEGEENVLAPSGGLLTTPSEFAPEYTPVMRFHFLGRTPEDPRARAIIKSEALETCYAIQDALPPEMLTL